MVIEPVVDYGATDNNGDQGSKDAHYDQSRRVGPQCVLVIVGTASADAQGGICNVIGKGCNGTNESGA